MNFEQLPSDRSEQKEIGKPLVIWIIDDSNSEMASEYLNEYTNHRVFAKPFSRAQDALNALDQSDQHIPDIVLVDGELVLDQGALARGENVIQEIIAHPRGKTIRGIIPFSSSPGAMERMYAIKDSRIIPGFKEKDIVLVGEYIESILRKD